MILLVGAGGQLGTELRLLAAEQGVALTALPRGELDISDPGSLSATIDRLRPDAVINAAAWTRVDAAETEAEAAFLANAEGPRNLARATAAAGIPLVHVSTDYVFDGSKQGAYTEADPIAPLGVYGRSKAEGEEAVRAGNPAHAIIRTSWVYGVHGNNIVKTVLRLARERDELRFVADQRGCPTATDDLARAVLAAALQLAAGQGEPGTFHFAGQGATTWHGFVEHVVEVQSRFTGRRPVVVPITTADFPTPAKRPANSELDSTRFARVFGVTAEPWRVAAEKVVVSLVS
jgi:dTDP-4-dehydrorhamnose reductase